MLFFIRSAVSLQVAGCSAGWRAQSASKYSRVSLLIPAVSPTSAASVGVGVVVDAGGDVAVGRMPIVVSGALVLDGVGGAVAVGVGVVALVAPGVHPVSLRLLVYENCLPLPFQGYATEVRH